MLGHSAASAEIARVGRAVRQSSHVEGAIASVVTGVVAPLAIGFDLWVRRRAAEHHVERLYYLARNARIPFDVACSLPRVGDDVDLRYLAVSRDLVRLASLAAVGPDTWLEAGTATSSSFLLQSLEGQDPTTCLKRLGLDPGRDRELLLRSGVGDGGLVGQLDPRRLLQHERLREVIVGRACEQLDLAVRYFCGEGIGSAQEIAMVDIGWQGQQAAMIEAILGQVPRRSAAHLHLGGYAAQEPVHPVRIEHWLFEDTLPAWLSSPVPLFETLFPSMGPPARGFRQTAAREVEVRFGDEPHENDAVDGAMRDLSARVAAALDPARIGESTTDLAPLALELAREFWERPSAEEARVWGRRTFERDGSGALCAELGRPFHADDLWRLLHRSDGAKRVWPEGAIAASSLPIRTALGPIRRAAQARRRRTRNVSRLG